MLKNVVPMFSRSFIVSDLIFRSLIHFEFIFVYYVKNVLFIFFYMLRFMGSQRVGHDWATELNWTELLKRLSFSIVYSCHLCCRLTISVWVYFSVWVLLGHLVSLFSFIGNLQTLLQRSYHLTSLPVPCCAKIPGFLINTWYYLFFFFLLFLLDISFWF